MRGSWAVLVSGVVVGLVMIGGCEDGGPAVAPAPVATPTAITTTPTSQPSSSAAGQVPKAARAHSPEGADAFARYYFVQVNKAWTTPDPGAIEGLSTEQCDTCRGFLTTAVAFGSAGRHYERNPVTVTSSAWLPESVASVALVEVAIRQEATVIVASDGSIAEHVPAERAVFRCTLAWSRGGWSMDEIQHRVLK